MSWGLRVSLRGQVGREVPAAALVAPAARGDVDEPRSPEATLLREGRLAALPGVEGAWLLGAVRGVAAGRVPPEAEVLVTVKLRGAGEAGGRVDERENEGVQAAGPALREGHDVGGDDSARHQRLLGRPRREEVLQVYGAGPPRDVAKLENPCRRESRCRHIVEGDLDLRGGMHHHGQARGRGHLVGRGEVAVDVQDHVGRPRGLAAIHVQLAVRAQGHDSVVRPRLSRNVVHRRGPRRSRDVPGVDPQVPRGRGLGHGGVERDRDRVPWQSTRPPHVGGEDRVAEQGVPTADGDPAGGPRVDDSAGRQGVETGGAGLRPGGAGARAEHDGREGQEGGSLGPDARLEKSATRHDGPPLGSVPPACAHHSPWAAGRATLAPGGPQSSSRRSRRAGSVLTCSANVSL